MLETPKFNFENILKIAFPVLIILGVIRLTSYYYQFNLSIIEYLDFTEILTHFLKEISFYILLFSIPLNMLITYKVKSSWPVIFLNMLFIIFLVIIAILNGDFIFNPIVGYVAFIALIIAISPVLLKVVPKYKVKQFLTDKNAWIILFFSLILIVGIITALGFDEAYYVKSKKVFLGTTINKEGQKIISDSTFYFIGKTNDFIFFFDEKKKSCNIYPVDKVDEIIYKANSEEFLIKGESRTGNHPPRPPKH